MNAVVDWQLPGTTRDREVWMARHGPPDGLDRFLRHGPAEIDRSGNEHVPRILGAMAPPDGSRPPCLFWMPAMSTLGLGAVGGGDWRASSQADDNVTSAGRSAGGWRALGDIAARWYPSFHQVETNIGGSWAFAPRKSQCSFGFAIPSLGDCQFWGGGDLGRRSWYRVLVLHL